MSRTFESILGFFYLEKFKTNSLFSPIEIFLVPSATSNYLQSPQSNMISHHDVLQKITETDHEQLMAWRSLQIRNGVQKEIEINRKYEWRGKIKC